MPEAFFLNREPPASGLRYCILHCPPAGTVTRGAVVYVHPWCEEMNKSRRMAALQARLLAAHGWAVLQVDLLGCGDSSGDFGDATWAAWVDDVVAAAEWLGQRFDAPLWLWGLRTGCLLACEAADRIARPCRLLFWQPATSGRIVLQQFLMLKAAALMQGSKAQGVIQDLRSRLAAGSAVQVAGYALAPALADGLAGASLRPPAARGRALWLEVSAQPDAGPSPAMVQARQAWVDSGVEVQLHVVSGPPFWQTTEIEDARELVDATLQRMLAETVA